MKIHNSNVLNVSFSNFSLARLFKLLIMLKTLMLFSILSLNPNRILGYLLVLEAVTFCEITNSSGYYDEYLDLESSTVYSAGNMRTFEVDFRQTFPRKRRKICISLHCMISRRTVICL